MPIKFSGPVKPQKLKSPDPINMPVVRDNRAPKIKADVEYYKENGEMPSVYDGPYIAQTQNLLENNKFAWADNPDQSSTTATTADTWTNSNGLFRIHTYSGPDIEKLGLVDGEVLRYARGSNTSYAQIFKTLDLDSLGINTALVDAGAVTLTMAALFGEDYNDSDAARYRLILRSADTTQLATYNTGYISVNQWSYREVADLDVPVNTRLIDVILDFDRNAGSGSNGNILAPYLELNVVNNGANISAYEANGSVLL